MSELKAAAERLLTERHYDYWECNRNPGAMDDAKVVGEFVKRLTDETQVTPELLDGLGFDDGILYDECGDAAIEFCGDTMFVFGGEVSLSDPLTLGQLRMLCQSLGIELAE